MDIKDLLPELRRMIQGPLQSQMAEELLSSAIIFCKESKILRQTIDVGSVSGGDRITLAPSSPEVSTWGTLAVLSDDTLLLRDESYRQSSRNEIEFVSDADQVKVVFWVIPKSASGLPDELLNYSQAICHGAASALYLLPNKSWMNGQLSQYHHRFFVEGYRDAWREIESEQFGRFQNPAVNLSYWI